MTERSIMVQCDRPDLETKYAFFNLGEAQLLILYVTIEEEKVRTALSERIGFDEYPEAKFLHDGKAWNIHEVNCWVRFAERIEERTK